MVLSPYEPVVRRRLHLRVRHCQQIRLSKPDPRMYSIQRRWPLLSRFTCLTRQSWWGALAGDLPWALAGSSRRRSYHRPRQQNAASAGVSGRVTFCCFTRRRRLRAIRNGVAELPHRRSQCRAVLRVLHPYRPANITREIAISFCCGVIVAAISYAVYEWVGAAYYLLAGVLVGNVWEAWRRVRSFSD